MEDSHWLLLEEHCPVVSICLAQARLKQTRGKSSLQSWGAPAVKTRGHLEDYHCGQGLSPVTYACHKDWRALSHMLRGKEPKQRGKRYKMGATGWTWDTERTQTLNLRGRQWRWKRTLSIKKKNAQAIKLWKDHYEGNATRNCHLEASLRHEGWSKP